MSRSDLARLCRPLGRFVVSLPKCQAAKLIESDFEFDSRKNAEIRTWVKRFSGHWFGEKRLLT